MMNPDILFPASTWLTVPYLSPHPSLVTLVSNPMPFHLDTLFFCASPQHFSKFFSLGRGVSRSSVFYGHVGGEEEHIGVILVFAEVYQVRLSVAHCPRVVLADSSPVTESRLQGQLHASGAQ